MRIAGRLLSIRSIVLGLVLLTSGLAPRVAGADGLPLSRLTPELSARLTSAAQNPATPDWQRTTMRRLASSSATPPDSAFSDSLRSAHPPLSPQSTNASDGAWSYLPVYGADDGPVRPFPRAYATMVYDPTRDRVVVFGGLNHVTSFNDVWVLNLSGTPVWSKLVTAGGPPAGRNAFCSVYDPIRDRMVIFGGRVGSSGSNDVWALSFTGTPTWTALAPSGLPPAPRFAHAGVYDPVRDRLLVFGGFDGTNFRNDVWSLTFAGTPTWTSVSSLGTPPVGRDVMSLVYDSVRDRLVMFGGFDGLAFRNDTYALTLGGSPTWSALLTATRPAVRREAGMIYDSARDQIVLYGGSSSTSTSGLDDTWVLPLSGTPDWAQASPGGGLPRPRWGHCAVLDPVRDRMVVFGGVDLIAWRSDTRALALGASPSWSTLDEGGHNGEIPVSGYASNTVYDGSRHRMLAFGGVCANQPPGARTNETWELDFSSSVWSRVLAPGAVPTDRYVAMAVYDAPGDRLIVFGGYDTNWRNDVHALSFAGTPTWSLLSPLGTPPSGRVSSGYAYDTARNRLLLFGGFDGTSSLNDVWALDLSGTPTWTQLLPSGTPPAVRKEAAMIYDPLRDRLVISGGNGATGYSDVWTLNLTGPPAWTMQIPSGTGPGIRWGHDAIYDPLRDRMVVFGGVDNFTWYNDVHALALSGAPVWNALSPSGYPPLERVYASAIYDNYDDRMVVFRGLQNRDTFLDTELLSFDAPTATTVSLQSAEAIDGEVRLAWSGSTVGLVATIARSIDGGGWSDLGSLTADGTGILTYVDAEVATGHRYGYHLSIGEGASNTTLGEVFVDIPLHATLALRAPQPNPTNGPVWASFTLPSSHAATLSLVDVGGRRLRQKEVGTLGAGSHLIRVDEGARLDPGLYWLVLDTGKNRLTARVVVAR